MKNVLISNENFYSLKEVKKVWPQTRHSSKGRENLAKYRFCMVNLDGGNS